MSMRRKQSGIFLVSAAIAVAVAGMLITFWGVNYTRQLRVERAERIGESLKVIGDATQSFAVTYHDRLNKLFESGTAATIGDVEFTKQGTSPPMVGNLTAENLIKVMNVRGAASKPPHGMGDYAIQVYKDCVGKKCDIKTLVYLTEPMKQAYSDVPDYDAAATAMRKIGVLGGISRQDAPSEFRFLDNDGSARNVVNPAARPGLIAMRGGHQTSAMDTLLSLDGRKAMTGSLNLADDNGGGTVVTYHNIVGAKDIQGMGRLQMGSLEVGEASIRGTLNLASTKNNEPVNNDILNAGNIEGTGRLSMSGIQADSATVGALTATKGATISGNLELRNNDIDGANSVKAKSIKALNVESTSLKSTSGVVELGKEVVEGTQCDVWGLGRDGAGRILSCQEQAPNQWKWKLSSPRVTRDNVPDDVRDQITSEARRESTWWMSKVDLRWGKSKLLHRGAVSVLYEARYATACVLDTDAKIAGGTLEYNYRLGRFVVIGMTRPGGALYCFSRGKGPVSTVATFWDGGKNMVGHGIGENPTWYRDSSPEFFKFFKSTMNQNGGVFNEGGPWHRK